MNNVNESQQDVSCDMAESATRRCGMVAIVGRANVGKSSILNTILEEKVSIVSHIAQTTRNQVRGIYSDDTGQLVFLDTPGVFKASTDLGRVMNRAAKASISGVDVVLLVLDPSSPVREEDEGWMRKLRAAPVALLVVCNKADMAWEHLASYKAAWARTSAPDAAEGDEVPWLSVSAKTEVGMPTLLQAIFERVPVGPALFPDDILTDFPRNLAIADVIREQYFHVLRDEVPHDLAVHVRELTETDSGWKVYADVLLDRPSQKGIVIGHKGRLLRRVTRAATRELTEMYGKPVDVRLWIKVEKHWSRNFWILRQLGYVS